MNQWTVGYAEHRYDNPPCCAVCDTPLIAVARVHLHIASGDYVETCHICSARIWPDFNELWDAQMREWQAERVALRMGYSSSRIH